VLLAPLDGSGASLKGGVPLGAGEGLVLGDGDGLEDGVGEGLVLGDGDGLEDGVGEGLLLGDGEGLEDSLGDGLGEGFSSIWMEPSMRICLH
jgi:hypothetical protein